MTRKIIDVGPEYVRIHNYFGDRLKIKFEFVESDGMGSETDVLQAVIDGWLLKLNIDSAGGTNVISNRAPDSTGLGFASFEVSAADLAPLSATKSHGWDLKASSIDETFYYGPYTVGSNRAG